MNFKAPKTLTISAALVTILLMAVVPLTDCKAANCAKDNDNSQADKAKTCSAKGAKPCSSAKKEKTVMQGKFEPTTERTEAIARYEDMRYGMFIQFEMITFLKKPSCGVTKGTLPPPQTYNPTKLDVDRWVSVAKKAGMKYAVLNAKSWHGFALWDSKYSDYDVAASGNKTDVVAEFVKACRKYGIVPCFLYSFGQDTAHRRDKAMTDDEWYEHSDNQIRELLTNYGPIAAMWFDGMGSGDFPAERVQQAYDTVKSVQPDCLVVMHDPGQVGRWPTDVFQPGRKVPQEKHNPKMEHNGKTYYIPMDVLGTVVDGYFLKQDTKLASATELLSLYRNITSRGSNFTLSIAPNREGELPDDQVERLMELAEAIRNDKNIQDKSVQFEPATERTEVIARYEELGYGTFINFGMWSVNTQPLSMLKTGPIPPAEKYHPTKLDVDQWIAAIKKAGMRYAVLDVKGWHGFAMWDSKFSDYDVAASGNKTDVVAEFVKGCRKYGIAPCFNYALGADLAHRRDKGMTDDEWYEHANNQIREVLSNYGPITVMWFDGMGSGDFPAERVRQAYDTVKSVQPDCLVAMHAPGSFDKPLKRWPTDIFQPGRHLPAPEGHNPLMTYNGKRYYIPMETLGWLTVIGKIAGEKPTRPLEDILKNYRDVTSRGANLTLVTWPSSEGILPANQVERLLELGEAIKELRE